MPTNWAKKDIFFPILLNGLIGDYMRDRFTSRPQRGGLGSPVDALSYPTSFLGNTIMAATSNL